MNRWHAQRTWRVPPASGFVSQPEPRTIGRVARGRQICAGNFMFAGHMVESEDATIWELEMPDAAFEAEAHGFGWLDDLAAAGDATARLRAQEWTSEWIARFGRGQGPGWTPDLTGRRLIRFINHAIFLLNGRTGAETDGYYRALAHQTIFLSRRWQASSHGVPRFEALTGLIYAGLSLIGMESHVDKAVAALSRECETQIDDQGGIVTRTPEELLEVFTLLTWASLSLSEAGRRAPPELTSAVDRIAPTLRALRHADGGLARFHGGGRGLEGRLDHALASSGNREGPRPGLAMGYVRLSAARTTVIVDAASPPRGEASRDGHASTLAFELTSGRRPVIVSCGSGAPFGEKWRQMGRATAAHSCLSIAGYSSSRFAPERIIGGRSTELLGAVPEDVRVRLSTEAGGTGLIAGHDGYVSTHGLTHVRAMDLSANGRGMAVEDSLVTISDDDNATFDRALDKTQMQGIPFQIRFHLHPDVDAELDLGGSAVSLALKSGEIWVFRHDGAAEMMLESSVFLEKGRLVPRATKQIVLSARAMEYATRVRWTLAKPQDTPTHLRDLERDDSEMLV